MPTDGNTDKRTDGLMDKPSYRDARTHLKPLNARHLQTEVVKGDEDVGRMRNEEDVENSFSIGGKHGRWQRARLWWWLGRLLRLGRVWWL